MNFWITLLAHQATWFAAVIGASKGSGGSGVLAVVLFVAWRLAISPHRGLEARLGALALALGWGLESLWVGLGLVSYAAPAGLGLAPAWILALWVGFALTVVPLLGALHARPLVAALVGAVGGPSAYWGAGEGWGAVQLAEPTGLALSALAFGWALAMPLLMTVARRGLRARSAGPAAAPEQEAGDQQEHGHQAHQGRDPARGSPSHHADMQRV
jgi:hypothetical protein